MRHLIIKFLEMSSGIFFFFLHQFRSQNWTVLWLKEKEQKILSL